MTSHDIDEVVSIVRYESGFNPDAANKSGSAAGLGSLKNDTRTQYKVKDIFDIETNAKAIIECYKDSKALARKHRPMASQEELDRWTYGFYHDGPKGKNYGGKEIFSRPNGVKGWIGPIERSLRTPKGSLNPRPSGFLEDPAGSFAATRPAAAPHVMDDLAERPNALDHIDPAIWELGALSTGENSATPGAYLGPVGRPNALGPIPAMWDPGALPTGPNHLASDPPMNLPPASSNLPFQHSPSGVRGPSSPAQPAFAPTGYPTWPLPSDSPLFPRRNALSEPARSVSPWGQPQSGRDGTLVHFPSQRLRPLAGHPSRMVAGSPSERIPQRLRSLAGL